MYVKKKEEKYIKTVVRGGQWDFRVDDVGNEHTCVYRKWRRGRGEYKCTLKRERVR